MPPTGRPDDDTGSGDETGPRDGKRGRGPAPTVAGPDAGPDAGLDRELGRRDPAFIARQLGAATRYVNYFSPEVRGREHLPAEGPVLVVGNHSNLFYMPDAWVVGLELVRRRGLGHPAYALGYDLLFGIPGVGPFLRRIGAIPAGGRIAHEALARGAAVLVYPGGDREASRPWTQRDTVDLGGHHGFVQLALEAGVPVVPVATHGSHDAIVVLARGERIARLLGLHRLRINVFPILLTPFGPTSVLTPPPPMPAAVTVEFLPPLDWSGLGPEAADDPDVVAACYEEVTSVLQAGVDRLHAEQPHPVLRGWANLVTHGRRRLDVPVVDVPGA